MLALFPIEASLAESHDLTGAIHLVDSQQGWLITAMADPSAHAGDWHLTDFMRLRFDTPYSYFGTPLAHT